MQRFIFGYCQILNSTMRSLLAIISTFALMANSCSKSNIELKEGLMEIYLQQCAKGNISGSKIILCVDSILEDSRCPSRVLCVWEGRGVVKFSLTSNHQTYPFILSTKALPNSYQRDTVLQGYKIELVALHPYPETGSSIPDRNRKVEIRLTRL